MKKFLASLFLLLSYSTAFAVDFPEPTGYVTDIYSVMTDTQKTDFEQDLEAYEKETGTEIAYLIIGTTEGMEIADYAVAVGNEWGVGKESVDNGILVITAIDDREFWIATGSQTEGYLTDSTAGNIFRNTVKPYFQDGKYYEGLVASFDDIKSALNGETIGTIADTTTAESESGFGILVMLFAGLGVIIWLGSVLGRSKAIWPGAAIGGGGGFIISVFSGFEFVEIIFAILFFGFMGLVFDAIVSAEYKNAGKSGRSPKWWGGGGWGGGSSSGGSSGGGGFGGFGGGGFSGGGGGGSW